MARRNSLESADLPAIYEFGLNLRADSRKSRENSSELKGFDRNWNGFAQFPRGICSESKVSRPNLNGFAQFPWNLLRIERDSTEIGTDSRSPIH